MKIIFDLRSTGCGNNGGSITLIKSANVLKELGHDVCLIDSGKNKHTWNKLHVPHIIVKNFEDIPNADVIIATGYNSVKHVVRAPKRCGLKTHWIRGWETWRMSETAIVRDVLNAPTIKIVNGKGLQQKLNYYKIESYIIKPGHDLDDYYPINCRKNVTRERIQVIGGLFHQKHKTKRSDWIIKFRKENNVRLWMMGTPIPNISNGKIDQYFLNASLKMKRELYNNSAIWLSPSTSEGLHLVPSEAMLTECPVIGTNAPLSGTDYLINGQTGLITENNYEAFSDAIKSLLDDRQLQIKLGKQAREHIISLGDRKKNMEKMIELFERLL